MVVGAFLIKPFINNSWWHATCEAEALEIHNFYPQAKIRIIPNGIDPEEYRGVEVCERRILIEVRKKTTWCS